MSWREDKLNSVEMENSTFVIFVLVGLIIAALGSFLVLKNKYYLTKEKQDTEMKVLPYESSKGAVLPFHSVGPSGYPKATFGVGCFWSGQQQFEDIKGVISTSVGYVGGDGKTIPTYKYVKEHTEDFVEVVTLEYDPEIISYKALLNEFWAMHDPTASSNSKTQYRSAVFFHDQRQKELALEAKEELIKKKLYGDFEIVTEVDPGAIFYLAEDEHQGYYNRKNYNGSVMGH